MVMRPLLMFSFWTEMFGVFAGALLLGALD